jgi:hypothetical protein
LGNGDSACCPSLLLYRARRGWAGSACGLTGSQTRRRDGNGPALRRGGKDEQRELEFGAQGISDSDQQYEVTQQINSIRALVEEWRQGPESQTPYQFSFRRVKASLGFVLGFVLGFGATCSVSLSLAMIRSTSLLQARGRSCVVTPAKRVMARLATQACLA